MGGKSIDYAGQRFGKLVVSHLLPERMRGYANWLCKCDCGGERAVSSDKLRAFEPDGSHSCRDCQLVTTRKYRRKKPASPPSLIVPTAQEDDLTDDCAVTDPVPPSRPVNDDEAISRYLNAAQAERGLSQNTAIHYSMELTGLARWLKTRQTQLLGATCADLRGYLAERVRTGIKPSTSREDLSAFRGFFRYFVREGVLPEDPTAAIAMPKVGRPLPKTLPEAEVEALLMAAPVGSRDRAMLEVLYAAGLRVSELINLTFSQVNLTQRSVRIIGKGDKERVVPIGEEAVHALQSFISCERSEILNGRQSEYLFPSGSSREIARERMTRQAFRDILKRAAKKAGITKPLSPHTLRHAFATHLLKSRGGSARSADAVRTQQLAYYADLHQRLESTFEDAALRASP